MQFCSFLAKAFQKAGGAGECLYGTLYCVGFMRAALEDCPEAETNAECSNPWVLVV